MKVVLILVFTALNNLIGYCQEPDTIFIQLYGIGGSYAEIPDGSSLTSSMGELMINTVDNFNQTLTQGFQQNSFEAVVGIIQIMDENIGVSAYPNPTTEFINLKIEGSNSTIYAKDFEFLFYDLLGQQISLEQNQMDDQTIRIDLKELPTGIYMIKVNGLKTLKTVSTFKITKTFF